MYKYILLAGGHVEGTKAYSFVQGQETIVVSDDPSLVERFPNKFKKVGGGDTTTDAPVPEGSQFLGQPNPVIVPDTPRQRGTEVVPQTPAGGVPPAAMGEEDLGEHKDVPDGTDVTKSFPEAEDASVVVFKQGRHYVVYPKDDPAKPIHRGDGFTNKKKAKEAIQAHAKKAH